MKPLWMSLFSVMLATFLLEGHSKGIRRAHERHLGSWALKVLVHTGTLTLEEDLDNKAFKAFGHSSYLI